MATGFTGRTQAMKTLTRTLTVSVFVLLTGCNPVRGGHELTPEDTYALVNSIARGDPEETVALYTRDGAILPPDRGEVKGTEAIRDFYTRYAAYVKRDYSFRAQSLATEVDMEIAVNQGAYTVRNIAIGQDVETGKYLNVFRRDGGKWKLWRTMWSPNSPVQSVFGYAPPA
jgi:ketosteroid isomerase-like protein